MATAILRLPQVLARCGLRKSSLYLRADEGLFPKPVRLGARASGWPESEVDAVNAARIAGRTDDEIRALVSRLTEQRRETATA